MDGSIAQGFQEQSILMQSRNTRREKKIKERGKTLIVFPGEKKETMRTHFDIMEKTHRGRLELGRSNFWCNLGIKMEHFLSEGMKLWGSAEICSQHPVALEKKYPLLVINPAVPACLVEKTSSKKRVSVKVFPLLNVNAIDLLSLIKLSVCFSLHNLDKK